MKKAANSKSTKGVKKPKSGSPDELRKPSKLKPLKNKEPKKSKNPKVFGEDEDDDLLPEDDMLGFDGFDSGSDFEEDDF